MFKINTKIMIKKIILASIAFSGLAFATDAQYSKASAANISFIPTYANIDLDPIFDKVVTPGEILDFAINYDTNNIVTIPLLLSSVLIEFSIDLDGNELELVALPTGTIATQTGFKSIQGFFQPIPQNSTGILTSFQVKAKTQLPDDGNPDVTLNLLGAFIGGVPPIPGAQDVTPSFTVGGLQGAGRIMEVQCASVPRSSFIASVGNIIKSAFIAPAYAQTFPVCTASVPEPSSNLAILVMGTFGLLGAASTLKRKLKSSKSTEKETTKVG